MLRGSLPELPMRLFRHGVNAGGVNPAVIKVEQRADREGVIDRFVRPAYSVKNLHVVGRYFPRPMVRLGDEPKKSLILLGESGLLQIFDCATHQFFAAQQFRRNCGVILGSKRTVVFRGGESRDKLSQARA